MTSADAAVGCTALSSVMADLGAPHNIREHTRGFGAGEESSSHSIHRQLTAESFCHSNTDVTNKNLYRPQ